MAFPQVAAFSTAATNASGTNHNVNMPTGISAGDQLLAYIACSTPGNAPSRAGWDALSCNGDLGGSSTGSLHVFSRIADGSEGSSVTFTTPASCLSVTQCDRITDYNGTPQTTAGVTQSSGTNPNPPALTPPGGASDRLWITLVGYGNGTQTISSYPSSYTNGRNFRQHSVTNRGVGIAYRELNAASEDPGSFTVSGSAAARSLTIAIEPAPTNVAPDTPTVAVDDFDHNSVDLSSSAFSDDAVGDTHTASQWQVDESGGDFSTPVVDSGTDTTNLTTRTLTGLSPETAYIARVRHRDSSGDAGTQWSAWSAASSPFTTLGVPTATITSPSNGTTIPSGGSIMLAGTATDAEDGPITDADLEWESNIDGPLGTGSPLHVTTLTDGTHNITFTATDADGNEDSDTISVTVGGGAGGGAPIILDHSPFVRS